MGRRSELSRAALGLLAAVIASGCAPVTQGSGSVPAGRWLEGEATAAGATRRYLLFVPSAWDGTRRLPLVVMLHGCTQDAEDFAIGSRMNEAAERAGALVAYPEQPPGANARTCWNWFDAAHQTRGTGEPAVIAAITREVIAARRADARRVHVAGISAGGAMAAIMGVTYPDIYAGVGIHSGVPFAAAKSIGQALEAMQGKLPAPLAMPFADGARRPALILLHGEADAVVSPANADLIARQWHVAAADVAHEAGTTQGYAWRRWRTRDGSAEGWKVAGLGHAWSGGNPAGSYADSSGPPAAEAMLRFFLAHSSSAPSR